MISKSTLDFLLANANAQPDRLLLQRSKWPDVDMDVVVNTLRGRQRMAKKLPAWSSPELLFPTELCTQQCSSQETALYKATVASLPDCVPGPVRFAHPSHLRWAPPIHVAMGGHAVRGHSLADLTGGLGVDSWAFSQCFEKVLYNEANPVLAEAAEHNFRVHGANNIQVSNCLLKPGNLKEILGDFRPDIIFLDPARRSESGRKVFLLEDCQPDVLTLKDELLAAAPRLLLKLSPMADITMLLERLGRTQIREVHVVAADGECKELLLLLERDWSAGPSLHIYENGQHLCFESVKDTAEATYVSGSLETMVGRTLFEPGKALAKAGLFNMPCKEFGFLKLARHTHLYLLPEGNEDSRPLPGKYFRINQILPLSSSTIKALSKQGIAAEVSTHNIPIKAEELKSRLKAASSPSVHIFGANCTSSNYLILTQVL